MTLGQKRLLLGLASTVMSLGIALWIWHMRPRQHTVELVDTRPSLEHLFAERTRVSESPVETPRAAAPVRGPLPEDVAAKLFPALKLGWARFMYDPQAHFWAQPNLKYENEFREHPQRHYTRSTNALGFRKDREIRAAKPDFRVLVTGDSHTEGVVPSSELFTELLEETLAARVPSRSVEVLNAAKGGYSFYNYLGVLDKFLDLEPDLFIVVVYGGNDFKELLKVRRYLLRLPLGPRRPPAWKGLLETASREYRAIVSQFLGQVLVFKNSAREIEFAREGAFELTMAMRDTCRERGVRMLFVYLPPVHDVQERLVQPAVDGVTELFDLTEEDLSAVDGLATELVDQVLAEGVPCVDLRDEFRRQEELLFWKTDHHLNSRGHALVAEVLDSTIAELLPR